MKISVIIPAYNSGEYIENCLRSIVDNTYKDLEIICINDGSKDNTPDILRKFQKEDPRIILIDQENKGISATRNVGLKRAGGELISFVDADDLVHQKYYETLAGEIIAKGSDIMVTGFERISRTEEYERNQEIDIPEARIVPREEFFSDPGIKYYVWGKLYRKEILENVFFNEDVRFAEDVLFNAEVFLRNPEIRIARIDLPLYGYLDHNDSLVHTGSYKEKYHTFRSLYHRLNHFGECNSFYNAYLKEVIKQSFATRYQCRLLRGDKETEGKINALIGQCMRKAKWRKNDRKNIFYLFYRFPFLYRLWRIVDDPTLIVGEKYEKKRFAQRPVQGREEG